MFSDIAARTFEWFAVKGLYPLHVLVSESDISSPCRKSCCSSSSFVSSVIDNVLRCGVRNKLEMAVLYGTPEGTFPLQYLAESN